MSLEIEIAEIKNKEYAERVSEIILRSLHVFHDAFMHVFWNRVATSPINILVFR